MSDDGDDGPQLGDELYRLHPRRPPPAGYPGAAPADPYAEVCFARSFEERRRAFLARVLATPASSHLAGLFHEVGRLAAGGDVHVGLVEAALEHVEARRDCADFLLHGLLRLLCQFADHGALPPALWARVRAAVLGFKYHPEEPGVDSLCSWTENHQILFAAGAFLAGGLFPDARFPNDGSTGREKRAVARTRILAWLELRFRTGMSEWLSHVYYDEDLVALLALVDFAEDDEVSTKAAMVVDLLLLDLALHAFRGVSGSTHGRSYAGAKRFAREEPVTDTLKLAFGTGTFARLENMSAVCLALSPRYRIPQALFEVARAAETACADVRQRMGIRLADGAAFGLGFESLEDGFRWLSMEAYAHPRTVALFVRMLDAYRWWESDFFGAFRALRPALRALAAVGALGAVARLFAWDLTRNLREQVDLVTRRTPDFTLSSALDWHPGRGGEQQHLWQATLGPEAVCFTTHPGPPGSRSPGTWTGSGSLPRVAQVGGVAIALYRADRRPALYLPNRSGFTHAWLPRDAFDEVRETGGWVFARRGDGYLALRSRNPVRWQDAPGPNRGRELVAPGRRNVWLCELSRRAECGDFESFVRRVAAAPLRFRGLRVAYESPSEGLLEFGWRGPLRRRGEVVPLGGHPRYESPWVAAPFPSDAIAVRAGGAELALDVVRGTRAASAFL